jgi:hypothetical protein
VLDEIHRLPNPSELLKLCGRPLSRRAHRRNRIIDARSHTQIP